MILHGDSVTLRPFDRRHADSARHWANDLEMARLLDRARPITDAEHERWYASLQGRSDCVYFAIETRPAQEHVGNIWLWDIDPRHRKAEVRVVIGAAAGQGRGLGTEAVRLLADFARERLNLRRLYAFVLGINPRACRAFEKAGFTLEGTLRQDRWTGAEYADVFVLGRLLESNRGA